MKYQFSPVGGRFFDSCCICMNFLKLADTSLRRSFTSPSSSSPK